ncbi:MAG: hypothetical protein D6675_04445 [Gemmatimonadetes bacterium]|nr:MAG: hypothetical protein D6675_04445 [Gemmatimonadota bacterium]
MHLNISPELPRFNRHDSYGQAHPSIIGGGSIGGKAQGLVFLHTLLAKGYDPAEFPSVQVKVPAFTVIGTDVFDAFMEHNRLYEFLESGPADHVIANVFQKGSFPGSVIGDLRAVVLSYKHPLAVRSSSKLEDALYEPFAGIYSTKMIPNNQVETDVRFHKLIEAVKFIYASTFFSIAQDYLRETQNEPHHEKMAVIIQEVVGRRHGDRFYPTISGVARSYNFYPVGGAKPEEGVVNLALGLGKSVVDGGVSWAYSPARPRVSPPFGSIRDWLKQTQTEFWAVNLGKPPAYDPIHETEYLVKCNLNDAEYDGSLRYIASTYDPHSSRIVMGTGIKGPRIITFAPILHLNDIPLNPLIERLLALCEEHIQEPVEVEFAMTLNPHQFGALQVRPMVVSHEEVTITEREMRSDHALAASDHVMGNGIINTLKDILYVKPEEFQAKYTPQIVQELEQLNNKLRSENLFYLLIGFGRWGSSDPWLGIPVRWVHISGAKVIVEATLPHMDVELSQGSHFFHNISSFQVRYFSVPHHSKYPIDWNWLDHQDHHYETHFLRHIRLHNPLIIKVDGRTGRGVIHKS